MTKTKAQMTENEPPHRRVIIRRGIIVRRPVVLSRVSDRPLT